MLRSMIAAALSLAFVASVGTVAEAKTHQNATTSVVTQFCGDRYGGCAELGAVATKARKVSRAAKTRSVKKTARPLLLRWPPLRHRPMMPRLAGREHFMLR